LVLRLLAVGSNVTPLSVGFLYKISQFPDMSSPHTTYILPPRAVTIGPLENPQQLLKFSDGLKLAPPSIDLLNGISTFLGVESLHTTYTLLSNAVIAGTTAPTVLMLRLSAGLRKQLVKIQGTEDEISAQCSNTKLRWTS